MFLGLGTGLGTAMIVDGIVEPMELGHAPYKRARTRIMSAIGGFKRLGKKKWREEVAKVIAILVAALEPTDLVIGGGNVKRLKELPPGARAGDNGNAFIGGFRMWDNGEKPRRRRGASRARTDARSTRDDPICRHRRPSPTTRPAWKALAAHFQNVRKLTLRELFAADPARGLRLTTEAAGVYLDYSKHRVTDETLALLVQLAEECGLRERIDAMFRGDRINISERPRGAARRAARAERRLDRRRRRERRAGRARGAGPDGRLRRPGPRRRMDGPHGQAR